MVHNPGLDRHLFVVFHFEHSPLENVRFGDVSRIQEIPSSMQGLDGVTMMLLDNSGNRISSIEVGVEELPDFRWALRVLCKNLNPADPALALKAALVLRPKFCASKTKLRTGTNSLLIGKEACAEFEPGLRGSFSSLTHIGDAATGGDAQVVLVPRFVSPA